MTLVPLEIEPNKLIGIRYQVAGISLKVTGDKSGMPSGVELRSEFNVHRLELESIENQISKIEKTHDTLNNEG
jgi:hypothetical protein